MHPSHRTSRADLRPTWWLGCLLWLGAQLLTLAAPATLRVDFGRVIGTNRPLHGINKGPRVPGGLTDLTVGQQALSIPFTRLHDCGWPNPSVVDIHAVFPQPFADPARPESYDFRETDEYISAVQATGAQIIYRLGESIEHTTVKHHVHPPADPAKWAAICCGIIRHYNEGWAGGFHKGIRYWEIWNEPENRPAMWSGTDADYLRLYAVAATAIKREFPDLKVGGPAVGASGRWVNGALQPTAFVSNFLAHCRRERLPLDFFSWHCYTADTTELTGRSRTVRQLLDAAGFTATESHLNEWNFLPGNSWQPLSPNSTPTARRHFYETMAGDEGAAFLVTALLELQDSPVDVCALFHGELGGFGLFDEYGAPQKNHAALRAFQDLVAASQRVATQGAVPGRLGLGAGRSSDGRNATIVLSNFSDPHSEFTIDASQLPWSGETLAEVRVSTAPQGLLGPPVTSRLTGPASIPLSLKSPGVAWIQLLPAAPTEVPPALALTSPGNRLVFQRNIAGQARVPVSGTCRWSDAVLEARARSISPGPPDSDWIDLGSVGTNGTFTGQIELSTGWYELDVRARRREGAVTNVTVHRVGVGEVFVVVGHSVAQGGEINLPGAADDRINTIAWPPEAAAARRDYERTGEARFLPGPMGTQFGSGVVPGPFGHGTYFWAQFAQSVAESQQTPVLILNAAFGGTSLEHWAKSARGEAFEHSFVKAGLRMPYLNLQRTLERYISLTGVRAILADQGQNDRLDTDENRIFANYQDWVAQARRDLGFPALAVVVNRQTPTDGRQQIRRVQDRMIREVTACYPGPDYDTLAPSDRPDGIHLSEAGAQKAALLWAAALDRTFFERAIPYQPR